MRIIIPDDVVPKSPKKSVFYLRNVGSTYVPFDYEIVCTSNSTYGWSAVKSTDGKTFAASRIGINLLHEPDRRMIRILVSNLSKVSHRVEPLV